MLFALWFLAASATQLPLDPPPRAGTEPRLAGAATPVSPTLCEAVAAETWRCAGLSGVEVQIFGPETARTLSFGGERPAFSPLPVAGRFSRTLDWRLDAQGRPTAALIGWRAAEGSAELVLVLRPAQGTSPGCLSAVAGPDVSGDALAAVGFRCGRDRPRWAGTIPPALRRALVGWLAAQ